MSIIDTIREKLFGKVGQEEKAEAAVQDSKQIITDRPEVTNAVKSEEKNADESKDSIVNKLKI